MICPRHLYEAIHRRRDVRGQFTGAPLVPDSLERMLAAAHAAPSVGLTQPWDFILVRDRGPSRRSPATSPRAGRLRRVPVPERAATFARIKIDGVLESTLSIVVTYDPDRGSPAVLGRHAIADAGLYSVCLAIQNLWLAATAEGLGVGWVSFYREEFLHSCSASPPVSAGGLAVPGPGHPPGADARPGTARLARAPPLVDALHRERWGA